MKYPNFTREEKLSTKLTQKQVDSIPILVKSGISKKTIAKKYNVSRECIYYWCKSEEERKLYNKKQHKNDTPEKRKIANEASKRAKLRKNKFLWKKWREEDHKKFLEKNPNYNKLYLRKWKEDKPEYDKIKKREQYAREKLLSTNH